jgi:hypothetical protein
MGTLCFLFNFAKTQNSRKYNLFILTVYQPIVFGVYWIYELLLAVREATDCFHIHSFCLPS